MSLVRTDRLRLLSLIMEMDSKPADAGWGIALHSFFVKFIDRIGPREELGVHWKGGEEFVGSLDKEMG